MSRNAGFDFESSVGAAGHGLTVLEHLVRAHAHSSVPEWRSRIAAGLVLVDRRIAGADQRLRQGQRLTWRRPPWIEPDAPLAFEVVYHDEHLVAVDKPSGLPTLPGGGFLESTLQGLVRQRFPQASAAHRLGRFTSGLVLFGVTAAARRGLAAAWREGRVHKRYLALASGSPIGDDFEVQVPIGPVRHEVLGTIHAADPGGRAARSRVRVVARGSDRFLAAVVIATGRPHQIRIHLAAAGHPLVGDPIYAPGGQPRPGCRALPGDPGYRLRAVALRLDHPVTRVPLALEVPARLTLDG